ncbi:MAG TPA: VOC family protein [Planctomycetota bacterium]
MSNPIVYFEVAGPDADGQRAFYSGVFGWGVSEAGAIDPASTGGLAGGLRTDPADKVFYLGVDDIPAKLEEVVAAGGQVVMPRTEVPGVVTFALFTDPAGNLLGLAEFGSWPE